MNSCRRGRSITLQGFDNKGRAVSISEESLLAPLESIRLDVNRLEQTVAGENTVTVVGGTDFNNLSPGTYILEELDDDNVVIGLGSAFANGGALHVGADLQGRFFSIENNIGEDLNYNISIIFSDSVRALSNNIPTGYEVVSFPNAPLDSVEVDLYVANDGSGGALIMTGTVTVTVSDNAAASLDSTSILATNDPYISVDISDGDNNAIINNLGLPVGADTYVGITGIPSNNSFLYLTAYTGTNRLFLTNATGVPMVYSINNGGQFYTGVSYGGALPSFPVVGSIYIDGAFSPSFDPATGVLSSVVANMTVTQTLAPPQISNSHVPIPLAYTSGVLPISAANDGSYIVYTNAVDPTVLFTSTLAGNDEDISLGIYVTTGAAPLTLINDIGVPMLLRTYNSDPSAYIVLQPGEQIQVGAINGTIGMTIVPGIVGVEVFYITDSGPAPNVYVGANTDNTFIPVSGTVLDPGTNLFINPTSRFSSFIPVFPGINANIIYTSDNNPPIFINRTASNIAIEYMGTRYTMIPGATVVGKLDLVSILTLTTQTDEAGPYIMISDQGIESVRLGINTSDDPRDSARFVDGVYSPILYDLTLPTTIGSYDGPITIVIPRLTNTMPVISNIYATVATEIILLNNSGYELEFANIDTDGSITTTDVPVGDTFVLPRASQFTMYIPVPTTNPVVINSSTSI